MNLGLLIPEFPTQTHVFFWREVRALEQLGVNVCILSTKKPRDRCPHPFAIEAAARTHYLFPPGTSAARELAIQAKRLAPAARYLSSIDRHDSGANGISALRASALRRARHAVYLAAAGQLLAESRRSRIDHVHVHSCADAAHVVALADLLGGPSFSLHLHGDLPVYGRDHRQKMERALFVAAAAKPMQAQVVSEVGLPEERTCTLIMGVNTEHFTPAPERDGGGPFRLITIGRLANCKGHKHALRALRRLRDQDPSADFRYQIVGEGPERGAIEAEIAELRLADRVELTGSLGEDAIRERLRQADAFVLSSVGIGEASPVAVMEAMASGVPVICSIIGGTPDMIDDGVDGLLVRQEDEAGLAEAMRRLRADGSFRNELGRAARRRAERQFDAKRRAQVLLDTIDAAKRRSATPAA